MKISELIGKLRQLMEEHGDLDMYVADDGEYPEYKISGVGFKPAQVSHWYGGKSWEVPNRIEVNKYKT